MNNYVHRGEKVTVLAPYAVNGGGGCLVGGIFGIAAFTAAINASVELLTVGSFDLAKDASTFNEGDPVYWDNVNLVATSNNYNNLIGFADLVQASGTNAAGGNTGDPTVRVRLNESYVSAAGWISSIFTLTAAQLIAMYTAPITLIPAPGAGKAVLVDQDILFEMATTATQFTGGGAVSFPYHGGGTVVHAGSVPASVVTAAAGSSYTLLGSAVAANGTTVPANTGVDITNATAAFAAGTGTAKVQMRYRIVTL
jgi:predicted RecA/RadA family phage recombinase